MPLLPLSLVWVFVLGLAIGSFLNVCVARLPYEKSLLWPGSSCPICWQRIRLRDNIPLVSYLLLRGRCRSCGCHIPWRYPLVELFTGLAFVALFYLEIIVDIHGLPFIGQSWEHQIFGLAPPVAGWIVFHHAVLVSFLLVVALCDFEDMEIPLSITVTGTLVGLVLSAVFPWPFPETPRPPIPVPQFPPSGGVYPWPVWYPLPDWLPAGSWQLGLATGLAGALAGMVVLRGVRFLFGLGRGIEGMGVGDADLMMMAGAFIGWQLVVFAFFVSVVPGFVFAIYHRIRSGDQPLPFGPSLAMGVVITVLLWRFLGPPFHVPFFDATFLAILVIGGAVSLLVISFVMRVWHFVLGLLGGSPPYRGGPS
jgi:leader peptidase (prepilin peptidase)/N-methyltransferase